MPELPEVETLRRSLEPCLIGRTIARVDIRRRDMVVAPGDPAGGFSRSRGTATPVRIKKSWLLKDMTIARLTRCGKQMAIEAGAGNQSCAPAVIVQLGMTGTVRSIDDPPAHTHVIWTLDNGLCIAFVDPRRFGVVRATPCGTEQAWADLGPDALTVRGAVLADRLARTSRPVKAALLDQAVVAGVGNIYADEALFASRVHPQILACDLDRKTVGTLAGEIRRILRNAINHGGSTIKNYRDADGKAGGYQAAHKVYGRDGLECTRCGYRLTGLRVAQRATVFCPSCQVENHR